MAKGWHILPAYDYSGQGESKAPKLLASPSQMGLVVPDLLGAKGGDAKWFEVKWKQRADWTRTTQRLETGLSLRLWEHYKRVQAISGLTVWLIFIHEDQDEVLAQSIAELEAADARPYRGGKMGACGMIFFPVSAFTKLPRYSQICAAQRP